MSTEIKRREDGTFAPGTSGNSEGRPKGRRNEITLLKESLELQLREQLKPNLPAIFEKIVELAMQGDRTMLKLLAELHLTKGGGDVKAGQEKVSITINGPTKEEKIIDVTPDLGKKSSNDAPRIDVESN